MGMERRVYIPAVYGMGNYVTGCSYKWEGGWFEEVNDKSGQ